MYRRTDSNETGSITELIHRLQSGKSNARDEASRRIWERYLPRLLTLARRNLDRRIRVLHDEEDVVQSMGRSFFRRVRRGDFDVASRDDLWALLVSITLNKTRNAADRHYAAIRDVRRVQPDLPPAEIGSDASDQAFAFGDVDPKPTPAEAAALNEALERRLRDLPEQDLRQVAVMKLEGYTNREVAEALECSERGVERKLNLIRKRWETAVGDLA